MTTTTQSILFSPAPYHILSYGTLLGTTFFHSFVNGIVAFRELPRPQFAVLQSKLFPIYFSMQTALPVVLAVTYPAGLATPSGLAGLLDVSNRWSALVPIATMFVTALANMVVVGPATTKCMRERKSQERKDGKKSYDPPPHSQEMVALNKKFGKLHGISSLLNMATFVASLVYGVSLSRRIV
ncbi:hypothetical protein DL546_001648 [Coniochaeta pulveracea]|uniref:TMEM205-like domain-containing protein n=1 Tax=Coniochaeta pulveracea TaxID=177199 RepID=A0A420XXA3_9PEZI|nr:hypothetical protein DL546_001648 [Coniochaeta pulveracea]